MSKRRSATARPWIHLLRSSAEGRNLGWLAGERVGQLLVGLVVGALVARHLGAADYGKLAFAIAFATLLSPFATAADGLTVRDLETSVAPPNVVMGSAAALSGGASIAGALVMVVITFAFPSTVPDGTRTLVLIVFASLGVQPLAVVDYWFQSRLDARRATIARNIAFAAGMAARVIAISLNAGVTTFAIVYAAQTVVAVALMVFAYRRIGEKVGAWRVHRPHLRVMTRQAVPLVLAGLSVILYMRIDQIMLGSISGPSETGLYSVAVLLSEVSWFLPVAVLTTLTPSMTRLWNRDPAAYIARLQLLFTGATATAYAVVVVSVGVGVWFIPLVYGREFRDAVPVFVILMLSTPFVFLGVMQSLWTINSGQQGAALLRTGLAAVINVAANVILLPPLGARGAAITTVTAQAVAALFANAILPSTRPVMTMQVRALRLHGVAHLLRDPAGVLRGIEARPSASDRATVSDG